jgi:pyruvate kinase
VSQGKGVNLPDSNPPLQVPTEGDLEKAAWAVARGVDFLGQSFVGTADELRTLRSVLPGADSDPLIVAKIERPVAVDNLESIMLEADAVMVARGDLGVEMEIATVPVVQQRILNMARRLGRPCIVATQMLQSMIESQSPTRAEASDIATAIRDGADAVMLSGETSVGQWPDLAVSTMARIAEVTESNMVQETAFPQEEGIDLAVAALCEATWSTVVRLDADGLLCRSRYGIWAARLSRARLGVPIIAVTDQTTAARRMALLRDVFPIVLDRMPEAIEEEPCCGLSASAVRAMLRVETSGVLVEVGSGSGDALHPALHLAVRTLGV